MNWVIAKRCAVIAMSIGSQAPVQAADTGAGTHALAKGCLIMAAAGYDDGAPTGAPANSPTMATASTWIVTGDGSQPAKALAQVLWGASATPQSALDALGSVVVLCTPAGRRPGLSSSISPALTNQAAPPAAPPAPRGTTAS